MLGEIRQINASLEAAVARDIAAEGGGALAQQIDGATATDAQDIARLIFLASLSTATNPVLGLSRSEILGYLAAPDRDIVKLRGIFDRLQSDAWYLHVARDGKLFFKNVENLKAKVATYARNKLREQREKELRERLGDMFKVTTRAAYQKVQALPALDQVQLQQDSVTLIVFRPSDDSFRAIDEFYKNQPYKNRVCFLTGAAKAYDTVLERAAELSAIRTIIDEMDQEGVRETEHPASPLRQRTDPLSLGRGGHGRESHPQRHCQLDGPGAGGAVVALHDRQRNLYQGGGGKGPGLAESDQDRLLGKSCAGDARRALRGRARTHQIAPERRYTEG